MYFASTELVAACPQGLFPQQKLLFYFSNKEISSYIPKSLTFEYNLNVFESTYIDSFNSLLISRAELVSENIRLEQEVKSLRALEIENSSLKEKIESFENISLIKNFNNLNFIETSLIIKNSSNEEFSTSINIIFNVV